MIQQLRSSLVQPIVLVALLAAAGVGFGVSSIVHGVSYHTGTAYSAEAQIGATVNGTGYAVPLSLPWLAVDGAWHDGGDRPACLPPTFVDVAQLRRHRPRHRRGHELGPGDLGGLRPLVGSVGHRRHPARLCRMCRSIHTLRTLDHAAPDDEVRAAALQYVRKVSGYRRPSPANEDAFNAAVEEIAIASSRLLAAVTATHPARRAS